MLSERTLNDLAVYMRIRGYSVQFFRGERPSRYRSDGTRR